MRFEDLLRIQPGSFETAAVHRRGGAVVHGDRHDDYARWPSLSGARHLAGAVMSVYA